VIWRLSGLDPQRRLTGTFKIVTDDGLAEPHLRFHRMLQTTEKALRLSLDEARSKTSHPRDKGDDVEADTRAVFEQFLPTGFSVGEGKVYDAYGDESAQADVVITNPDHPFRYPRTKTGAYMVEGVAAVGEVKSVLTKPELKAPLQRAQNSSDFDPPSTMTTKSSAQQVER
jgi:hypothetical protein